MSTFLPCDDNFQPIPALRLRPGGAHAIAAGAASACNTVPFAAGTSVISVCATGPVFLRTGGSDVVASASDHYFPAGLYYDLSLGDGRQGDRHSHLAVVSAEADCMVYLSEKE